MSKRCAGWAALLAVVSVGACSRDNGRTMQVAKEDACPEGMRPIGEQTCIDAYEASLVVVGPDGERPHPHYEPVGDKRVKAVSREGVHPQGHISRDQAKAACREAGKRLCTGAEWERACLGQPPRAFSYAQERVPGRCNDNAESPLEHFFGGASDRYEADAMNDPRLNQLDGVLKKTGELSECRSSYEVYDMVGNLSEWVSDAGGVFRGGFYLDVERNGNGCSYETAAHGESYYDYSTGFRCCKGSPKE